MIRVKAKDLAPVANVAKLTKNKGLPVLSNIRVTPLDNAVEFHATDLELALTQRIPATCEPGPAFLVPRQFAELVKRFKGEEIDLKHDGSKLVVSCGKAKSTMSLMPADEYPATPDNKVEVRFSLPSGTLLEAIERTVFATLEDSSRPFLTAILLTAENGHFSAVATDINRLALAKYKLSVSDFRVMLPVSAARELKNFATSGDIEVMADSSSILFRNETGELRTRLIQGSYPDYAQVIPRGSTTTVIFNTKTLGQALERAALASDSARFDINVDSVHLSASEQGEEQRYDEDLEAIISTERGPDDLLMKVGFNARYILDALKAVDEKKVLLNLTTERAPALLLWDDAHYEYILMPVVLAV